jgi:hypothetical protein
VHEQRACADGARRDEEPCEGGVAAVRRRSVRGGGVLACAVGELGEERGDEHRPERERDSASGPRRFDHGAQTTIGVCVPTG